MWRPDTCASCFSWRFSPEPKIWAFFLSLCIRFLCPRPLRCSSHSCAPRSTRFPQAWCRIRWWQKLNTNCRITYHVGGNNRNWEMDEAWYLTDILRPQVPGCYALLKPFWFIQRNHVQKRSNCFHTRFNHQLCPSFCRFAWQNEDLDHLVDIDHVPTGELRPNEDCLTYSEWLLLHQSNEAPIRILPSAD